MILAKVSFSHLFVSVFDVRILPTKRNPITGYEVITGYGLSFPAETFGQNGPKSSNLQDPPVMG